MIPIYFITKSSCKSFNAVLFRCTPVYVSAFMLSCNQCVLTTVTFIYWYFSDIRPYKCKFCDYYARTNSQLKVHMMRHQG